ncbi:MAG: cellulase family glycosylhydrolase [Bacteroidales bacterium]
MKFISRSILVIILLLAVINVKSQAPFSRGVNLTGWFQSGSAGQIQFTRFTKQDILNIKSLGCDVIRLPVNMHEMTSGSPSWTIDPFLFSFLDSLVSWCEELHIYLILDNHSFDPSVNTSPGVVTILVKVWTQMAIHYKERSDFILYEILNEPHGISTSDWGNIQNQAINAIRAHDTRHTIVVGGSGYNTYTELKNLPVYQDTNLLYTFHFYDPFLFTHQGATWVSPTMEPLSGVPFPYCGACMPLLPESLKGSWIESAYNNYSSEGRISYVQSLIDNAVQFRNSRNVKIFCGEFGVYIPNSDLADRAGWYGSVREYLEQNNIPWTTWDYKGGFGLFRENSNELFEHDLNILLLNSLGLNIPRQTPYTLRPDSTGFIIYSDFIGEKINEGSYTSGKIDFYSPELPNNDSYCISWNEFSQYNTIGFNFQPDRNLGRLVSEGYALDFMVRGVQGIKFDIRFMDTKTSAGDHPWRMGVTIDETMTADRHWHHVHIPLSDFGEKGSWDNNTWYNSAGQFDWTAVDKLEISTEYLPAEGKQIWFDNIHITNRDTAVVRESAALGAEEFREFTKARLKTAPNPMYDHTVISYNLLEKSPVTINIFSIAGNKILCLLDEIQTPGEKSVVWNGCDEKGSPAGRGIYLIQVTTPTQHVSGKVIKQ